MSSCPRLLAAVLVILWPAALWAADAAPLAAGDTWTYRTVNGYNGLAHGTWTQTVTAAAANDIRVELRGEGGGAGELSVFSAPGQLAAGALNPRAGGRLEPALQLLPIPLEEGKRWRQSVTRFDPVLKQERTVSLYGKVAGWETVKVPAGEFRALRIEREIFLGDHDPFRGQTKLTEYEWYVPELKHWARLQSFEEYHLAGDNAAGSYYQGERLVSELLSFQPGKR
jgi:hypothetical protein